MANPGKQEKIRTAGIYLIIILALLRFLIYPLYNGVERQKRLLADQQENYRLKIQVLNSQRSGAPATPLVEKAEVAPYVYEKTDSLTSIQLDVVNRMSLLAKEKGGELVRFEMLEASLENILSEAPVTLWFSGQPKDLMAVLQGVETTRKSLGIKTMEISKGAKGPLLSLTLSAYRLEK